MLLLLNYYKCTFLATAPTYSSCRRLSPSSYLRTTGSSVAICRVTLSLLPTSRILSSGSRFVMLTNASLSALSTRWISCRSVFLSTPLADLRLVLCSPRPPFRSRTEGLFAVVVGWNLRPVVDSSFIQSCSVDTLAAVASSVKSFVVACCCSYCLSCSLDGCYWPAAEVRWICCSAPGCTFGAVDLADC